MNELASLPIVFGPPKNLNTRNGIRDLRISKMPPDHPGWAVWRNDKELVKRLHFGVAREYQGQGWELQHWDIPGESSTFAKDLELLRLALVDADAADARAKEAQKIDWVAEDAAPLVTAAAGKLFGWQRPSCQRVVGALMDGNALDASQTGAGKTFVALAACAELGLTPFVIAPLAVLESWKRAAAFMGVPLGGVTNWDKARNGSCPFIRMDGVKAKASFTFAPPPSGSSVYRPVLIADECLPGDAMVSTPSGVRRISGIVPGELVDTPIGPRRVLRSIRTKGIRRLVRVATSEGVLRCTDNHRVFTNRGWLCARDIASGDALLYGLAHYELSKTMRLVRGGVPSSQGASGNPTVLLKPMQVQVHVERSSATFRTVREIEDRGEFGQPISSRVAAGGEHAELHESTRDSGEGVKCASRSPVSKSPWWQWLGVDGSTGDVATRFGSAVGAGVCGMDSPDFGMADHDRGLGATGFEAGGGVRRSFARSSENETPGCEEGTASGGGWLDAAAVQESGNHDNARTGFESNSFRRVVAVEWDEEVAEVFDIEVEKAHCFFAGGFLVHNCQKAKAQNSLQSRVLTGCAIRGAKVLCLSATAAKDPTEMHSIGMVLGLHGGGDSFAEWAKRHGCRGGKGKGMWFTTNVRAAADIMGRIHRMIFPARGTRIRAADVPDYPDNLVSVNLVDNRDIKLAYEAMSDALESIEADKAAGVVDGGQAKAMGLAEITKARRASEFGKLDWMIDEARELVADGFQVAVFLNFREHLAIMRDALKLKTQPVWGTAWLGKEQVLNENTGQLRWVDIDGAAQKPEERTRIIDDFQSGAAKVILVSLMAGGAGISLHDLHGIAPRQSLISPSYSVIDLVQALGRIWRAGSHSKATQRIIFAAGTIEEEVAISIESKCRTLEILNDGDLMPDSLAKVLKTSGEV